MHTIWLSNLVCHYLNSLTPESICNFSYAIHKQILKIDEEISKDSLFKFDFEIFFYQL